LCSANGRRLSGGARAKKKSPPTRSPRGSQLNLKRRSSNFIAQRVALRKGGSMLRLSDEEMTQIFRCAAPLPVSDRDRFLENVASKLAGVIVGPGSVYKACLEAQRELLDYPDFSNGSNGSWSKYR